MTQAMLALLLLEAGMKYCPGALVLCHCVRTCDVPGYWGSYLTWADYGGRNVWVTLDNLALFDHFCVSLLIKMVLISPTIIPFSVAFGI